MSDAGEWLTRAFAAHKVMKTLDARRTGFFLNHLLATFRSQDSVLNAQCSVLAARGSRLRAQGLRLSHLLAEWVVGRLDLPVVVEVLSLQARRLVPKREPHRLDVCRSLQSPGITDDSCDWQDLLELVGVAVALPSSVVPPIINRRHYIARHRRHLYVCTHSMQMHADRQACTSLRVEAVA